MGGLAGSWIVHRTPCAEGCIERDDVCSSLALAEEAIISISPFRLRVFAWSRPVSMTARERRA